ASAPDGSGDYFAAWTSAGPNVEGNWIEQQEPLGFEFEIGWTPSDNAFGASIAILKTGDLVATYTDTGADPRGDIFARILPASEGNTIDISVDTSLKPCGESDVAALADGGFVVTWTQVFSGTDEDIRASVYNADGTLRGAGNFIVDDNTHVTSHASVA